MVVVYIQLKRYKIFPTKLVNNYVILVSRIFNAFFGWLHLLLHKHHSQELMKLSFY